jgi:RNA 2',3'-cyclic 3'-phosphodiesterase
MSEMELKHNARVFFALWPNDEERAAIAAWQPPLKQLCGGSATPVQNLHNTLVFLGDVAEERLEALQLAAQEVKSGIFHVVFDSARYWGHNHIVFASPSSVPGSLTLLVQNLQQSLLRHQFKFDQRGYQPHITLLRHAHWADSPLPAMQQVRWKISEFALVQSVSAGQGVRYEVLARFSLTPAQG